MVNHIQEITHRIHCDERIIYCKGYSECGWSTVSEILLNGKKCALLAYSDSLEHKELLAKVIERHNGIKITCQEFQYHLGGVLRQLENLDGDYSMYRDDRERIVGRICGMGR